MAQERQFPRWLFRGNDLAQGVIVHDEQQAADAEGRGFSEYEPAAAPVEPAQPMVGDGIAIPTIADVGAAAPRTNGGRRKAGG